MSNYSNPNGGGCPHHANEKCKTCREKTTHAQALAALAHKSPKWRKAVGLNKGSSSDFMKKIASKGGKKTAATEQHRLNFKKRWERNKKQKPLPTN